MDITGETTNAKTILNTNSLSRKKNSSNKLSKRRIVNISLTIDKPCCRITITGLWGYL